jgi:3-phenylpropionate/trans-cinnamate dioxygenase ferredoxin reductase subunit
MLGISTPHTEIPYFWSDLADWTTLEYLGPAPAWDDEAIDGDVASGTFSITYTLNARPVAFLSVNGHADLDAARAQLTAAAP